jgi:integration host factor subunit beta
MQDRVGGLSAQRVRDSLLFVSRILKLILTTRIEGEVMTKADLIDEVSRLAELTRKDSEVIVETIFDSVVRSLRAGDKIEIRGFGSFRTRQRKPRVGRNPKTGERVEVPAKKIPFFKPSKELKDLVNETTPGAAPSAPGPPAPAAPPTA